MTKGSLTVWGNSGAKIVGSGVAMLDVRSGRVAYAVLSSAGLLGVANTLRAVPWIALTFDTDKKVVRVNTTADRIKSEPGFETDNWRRGID